MTIFHAAGARVFDHGLESALSEPARTRRQRWCSTPPARAGRLGRGAARYGSYLMLEFGKWDAARLEKQLHPVRCATTTSASSPIGPDTGFDSIGDFPKRSHSRAYLNTLDSTDQLPRTILYNNNRTTITCSAQMMGIPRTARSRKSSVRQRLWFLDQKEGMESQTERALEPWAASLWHDYRHRAAS